MKDFTVTYRLSIQQISDVLCASLEGGSNYWCRIAECLAPTTWEFESEPISEDSHYAQDYPLNPGGALLIIDEQSDDDGALTLDWDAIQKGLTVLAEKYPWHFANILSEDADAETGDALLQCSLFGRVIYGKLIIY